MTQQFNPNKDKPETAINRKATLWLWLSIGAALLAVAGNIIALTFSSIYAGLTAAFLPQAVAQDVANLAFISPAWLILAALALRGSLRAYLMWLGVMTFTVYNYVIYTFSVPFGPLFLLWVTVFGLSTYSLIGGIAVVDQDIVKSSFTNQRANTVIAWLLIITAVLFGFLWLSEDLPALISGSTPQSLIDLALPTNPVHILDLGFFLPAVIIIGVQLMRKKALGNTLAAPCIVFLLLTGIPILITPAVQAARGEVAGWGVVAPIGILSAALIGFLAWLVSTIKSGEKGP